MNVVALNDHRQQDLLEVLDGSVGHRDGGLLHLLSDSVFELLDGVRLAPVHHVLQVPSRA